MDIWMYDVTKPALHKTLHYIVQQLLGKLIVNIVDKELIISESISNINVYVNLEEINTLNFEISGRKNSKIER